MRTRLMICLDSTRRPNALRTSLLVLMCLWLAPVWGQQVQLPPVERTRLENGAQVILMPTRRAPLLTVIATFPGGRQAAPQDKAGLAEMTAEVMRKGTETKTALEIAEAIDFLGGSLETSAGDDRLTVSLNVLAKDADAGLDLIADILRHPTFPEEELKRVRELHVASLQSLSEAPEALADYVLPSVVYGGHPYGMSESISSLNALSRGDLQGHYKRVVTPERMILVVVGDISGQEMLAKVRARFDDWKRSDTDPVRGTAPGASAPRLVVVDKPDATQTQARFGRTALPRFHPDYFPSAVAEAILGSGFTSRLTDEIRVNRSLTYHINAGFDRRQLGGHFSVSAYTKLETTRELLDAVRDVLRQTADKGFTDEELKRAKSYLSGQFAIQVQTPQDCAARLTDMTLYGLPEDELQTYLPKLRAVTLADANRVARTYFTPDALSIVLVGPKDKVSPQLSGLGSPEFRTASETSR